MAFVIFLGILGLLLLIPAVYGVTIYNGLVSLRNNIDRAWSNIDVLLKQRFDELPKLIKVCEGYMQHEQKTLEAVIKARSMVQGARGPQEKLEAQNLLTDTLKSLFMVVERYPELKADTLFRSLGSRISEIEDQIADRREFFNDSVNLYNIRIEQFPDVIIARGFNFARRSLWKIDPAHRQDVEVIFQHT
ncbi:MAG: LemA family protein [Syntrophotalea acetylenica]|jgi:LemA protein|uniref:LemA family protein n=1 Tax=Syntrophotalea acetylenica TaxID=29542 RepID=A0A1L3GH12_SYNAC|nr:LemA family protein [Syntrophotalea acetylenica]APG25145.1 LemA family protein [Syntrophotalea acetylenica]APG43215.1 LemA family protein [Syntrophotalea acetylenica]MDD4457053.1 LemA family protein [Syntrophotalea acetylenica]MDY0261413.1 LemA family protein [Syntrophotalea acetylenica]